MRLVQLLAVMAVASLALTGVAQASEENIAVKTSEGGALLENFTRGIKTLIHVTEPAAARECEFEEPNGKIQKNVEPTVEFRFPTLKERKCKGGATQERFGSATVAVSFEGKTAINFSEFDGGHVKLGVGSCLYDITGLNSYLSVPGLVTGTVSGVGRIHTEKEEKEGCAKEVSVSAAQEIKYEETEKALYVERI